VIFLLQYVMQPPEGANRHQQRKLFLQTYSAKKNDLCANIKKELAVI